MTFYRWLDPFVNQHGPFYAAACYAHSDFDFPQTANVHEINDYIGYLRCDETVKSSFQEALAVYAA